MSSTCPSKFQLERTFRILEIDVLGKPWPGIKENSIEQTMGNSEAPSLTALFLYAQPHEAIQAHGAQQSCLIPISATRFVKS